MGTDGKKGVSDEAKARTKEVRKRFVDFVKSKGLSEVSGKTGVNYQALRNSYVGIEEDKGYNPSIETIFQVKLGYGDDFDEVYVFTGKKVETDQPAMIPTSEAETSQIAQLQERLAGLQERLDQKDLQIKELKEDKAFLQSLIKKQ